MLRRYYDMFFIGWWETFVGSKSRIMHYATMTTQNVAAMTTQNVAAMTTQNVASLLRHVFYGLLGTVVSIKCRIIHYFINVRQRFFRI